MKRLKQIYAILLSGLMVAKHAYAQPVIKLDELLKQNVDPNKPTDPNRFLANFGTLGDIVSKVLTFAFALAGTALLIFLIKAGFDYLTSAGDPKKMEGAKNSLTSAIIGFIIIIVAFWLTQIVNYIFGLGGTFQ